MNDYELYHSGARKHHKYIKKIGNRYFYSQQEIAAYLKEKKQSIDDIGIGTVTTQSGGKAKPIGIKVRSDKRRVTDKDGYFKEGYHNEKGVYVKDKKITAYSRKGDSTKEHTLDLSRKKRRNSGSKAIKKHSSKSLKSMKSQVSKGKKKMHKFYKEWINPDVTVSFDEAQIH